MTQQLPNCPQCSSPYTYEDGLQFVCPECAYEWTAGEELVQTEQLDVKDANGNPL